MRTLKIFIIAISLFLFAIPVTAADYPPEMPNIQSAPIQFVCETASSLFLKAYFNLDKKWQVLITGRNKQEMMIEIISKGKRNIFALIHSIDEWKNVDDIRENKGIELEKFLDFADTGENNQALKTCIEFNLRSLSLLQ